jgi:hypothetical protein
MDNCDNCGDSVRTISTSAGDVKICDKCNLQQDEKKN